MSAAHSRSFLKRPSPGPGDIGCDRAGRLFDDYLEYRLGKRDRQRLETHLVHCPSCAKELRARPLLEDRLRSALGASVRPVRLSPGAGARIVRAAQRSARRGVWLNRALIGGRLLAGAASILFLLVSLAYILDRVVLPWTGEAISSFQSTQSPPARVAWDGIIRPGEPYPGESLLLAQPEAGAPSPQGIAVIPVDPVPPSGSGPPVTYGLVFDPGLLQVGEPFTTTLLVSNEQDQPLPVSQLNLDIEGPQRNYHFELAVSDPLPADRDSVLRITPGSLAEAIQERYQVSPREILRTPGVYTIRITLFHAAVAPDQ